MANRSALHASPYRLACAPLTARSATLLPARQSVPSPSTQPLAQSCVRGVGLEARNKAVTTAKASPPPHARRQRKPNLASALRQAPKAGASVQGAVIDPSGKIELRFGEPEKPTTNPWEAEI